MRALGALFLLLTAVSASNVLELDINSFDATLDNSELVLVKFYAPWCRACKRVRPEYEKAAAILADLGVNIQLAKLDVEVEESRELVDRYRITRFPTFFLFHDAIPEVLESFWSASAESIVASVQKLLDLPPVPPVKALSNLTEATEWLFWRGTDGGFLESAAVLFLPSGAAADDTTAVQTVFEEASTRMVSTLRFAKIEDDDIIDLFQMPTDKPSIALYKEWDEGKDVYDGPADLDELMVYLQRRNTPLVTIADDYSINRLQQAGNILVHVFVHENTANTSALRAERIEEISVAALKLEAEGLFQRGDVTFALSNGDKNGAWVSWFKLPADEFPSVGIFDGRSPSDRRFYSASQKQLAEVVPGNAEDARAPVTRVTEEAVRMLFRGELTTMRFRTDNDGTDSEL